MGAISGGVGWKEGLKGRGYEVWRKGRKGKATQQRFQTPYCGIRGKRYRYRKASTERGNIHKKLLSKTDHPSSNHYGVSEGIDPPPLRNSQANRSPQRSQNVSTHPPNLSPVIHPLHSVPSPLPLPPTQLIPHLLSSSLSPSRPPAPPLPAEASAFHSPAHRDPAAPPSLPPVAHHTRTPSVRRSYGGARVLRALGEGGGDSDAAE